MRLGFLVVWVGCGRIGFDGTVARDAAHDALAPTCAGPDEDSDGVANDCDNCPAEPNPTQQDTGEVNAGNIADGIGDVCDPRPTLGGDVVYLFDPLDVASSRYNYNSNTSYTSTGLRVGSLVDAGDVVFATPLTVTRIDTTFVVVEHSTTDIQWIGVWSEISPDYTTKIFSQATANAPASSTTIRIKEQTDSAERYSPELIEPVWWGVGSSYRLVTDTARATGGDYRLSVSIDGGVVRSTTLALGIPPGGEAYLESEFAIAEFRYLLIYATP